MDDPGRLHFRRFLLTIYSVVLYHFVDGSSCTAFPDEPVKNDDWCGKTGKGEKIEIQKSVTFRHISSSCVGGDRVTSIGIKGTQRWP